MFSPSTSLDCTCSYTPSCRRAATAAPPYGACAGFAIAILRTLGSVRTDRPLRTSMPAPWRVHTAWRPVAHRGKPRRAAGDACRRPGGAERVVDGRRQEQVERRAVLDLREEIPGRPERERDFLPGSLFEPLGHDGKRGLQIGSRCDPQTLGRRGGGDEGR